MKTKLFGCLSAAVLGAAIVVATPAMAGGGGVGGMHGGGMMAGGTHGGGMVAGGMHGGSNVMGRSVVVPGGNRVAGAPVAGQRFFRNRFNDRIEDRFEHHHRFRNFAFFGVPFAVGYDYGYGRCWRKVWTGYGWQWVNVCYDYGH